MIEILIAISIMAVFFGFGVPVFVRSLSQTGISKAVKDTVEACNQARAQAIVTGAPSELVFSPSERTLRVVPGGSRATGEMAEPGSGTKISAGTFTLPEGVQVEVLGVNFKEIQGEEVARIHFFPNGTSDEFTVIYRSDGGEMREVSLELVTGLTRVKNIK